MSRVHEPTIGDQTREMEDTISVLDLPVPRRTFSVVERWRIYIEALQCRRASLLEDLAAIRRRETDLTAQMVKVRAATVAELEVCERALDRAGATYEVDDE